MNEEFAGAPASEDFVAYRIPGRPAMELVTASSRRQWMDQTRLGNATHCLPLVMANQSGWFLLNPQDVRVSWNGGSAASDLRVAYRRESAAYAAGSHFGYGIVSFQIPYLFRTPPGWNLLARGPANLVKDGAGALEGVVETDWAPMTFTMNWQLTRPGHPVVFEAGEPICMLVPARRADLERLVPRLAEVEEMPDVAEFRLWSERRREPRRPDSSIPRHWQHDYLKGRLPSGAVAAGHQRSLRLRPFRRPDQQPG